MDERRPEPKKGRTARREFDRIDLELIKLLIDDPRRSQRALAKEVRLSPPAVAERITHLESSGAITGYSAQVDLAVLGYGLTVYADVSRELGPDHREQSLKLTEIDEVESVILTTGPHDLMLKINVKDRDHLNEVLFEKLIEGTVRIRQSNTRVSLAEFSNSDFREKIIDRLIAELNECDDE